MPHREQRGAASNQKSWSPGSVVAFASFRRTVFVQCAEQSLSHARFSIVNKPVLGNMVPCIHMASSDAVHMGCLISCSCNGCYSCASLHSRSSSSSALVSAMERTP